MNALLLKLPLLGPAEKRTVEREHSKNKSKKTCFLLLNALFGFIDRKLLWDFDEKD